MFGRKVRKRTHKGDPEDRVVGKRVFVKKESKK